MSTRAFLPWVCGLLMSAVAASIAGDASSPWRQSGYVPDLSVWRAVPIRPKGFQFEIQMSSLGSAYDPERVRRSIRGHNLGDYESAVSKVMAPEWGYSFTHLDGQSDGAGRKIQAGYPTPPARDVTINLPAGRVAILEFSWEPPAPRSLALPPD